MIFQRTIKNAVTVTGVGLHSGFRVKLTFKPAKVDEGIIFVRTDIHSNPKVRANPFLVNDTRLSSTLVDANRVRVGTVEHVMSALACFGIDNLIVEISAPEMPIMDGSSNSFLYLLTQAEVIEQNAKKKYLRIKKELEVVDGDKWVKLSPYDGYKVKLGIKFNHPLFTEENSSFEIDFSNQSYVDEISRARTFAFMYEIENIHKNGLGRGGNLNNAIVVNDDDDTVLNVGGLRFKDEFVRHKILDAIGDLYIVGHPLIGFFEGYKSGHAINNKLLRKLLDTPDAWEYVTFDSEDSVPKSFHHI